MFYRKILKKNLIRHLNKSRNQYYHSGGSITASKITEILETLSDGKWHSIEEIQQKMKLSRIQIQKIITFLKEYNFVAIDEANKKIRINKNVLKFLTQTVT